MKKQLSLISAVTLLVCGSALAMYQDVDTHFNFERHGQGPNAYWTYDESLKIGGNTQYESEFNIVSDDFDFTPDIVNYVPGTPLWKADIWFNLRDDNDQNSEKVKLTFDFDQGLSPGDWHWVQNGDVMNYMVTFTVGDAGNAGTLLVDLTQNGELDYKVKADSGDFWLDEAGIKVWLASEKPQDNNTVPDGGASLALLGIGLIGLGALKRKLS